MPLRGDTAEMNLRNASNPPADAPIPAIGGAVLISAGNAGDFFGSSAALCKGRLPLTGRSERRCFRVGFRKAINSFQLNDSFPQPCGAEYSVDRLYPRQLSDGRDGRETAKSNSSHRTFRLLSCPSIASQAGTPSTDSCPATRAVHCPRWLTQCSIWRISRAAAPA